jgi:hypothetical protein
VEKQPGVGVRDAGILDPGRDALDKVIRRRQRLAKPELSGRGIERRHIREGSANVCRKA